MTFKWARLCFAVTVFVILSVHKTDSTGITAHLSTFLSNIINQKLAALNPVNMQLSSNQSTIQPSLVTIVISPNHTVNTTSQSQSPAVAAAESEPENASQPANGGAAAALNTPVEAGASAPTMINQAAANGGNGAPPSTQSPAETSAASPTAAEATAASEPPATSVPAASSDSGAATESAATSESATAGEIEE